MRRGTWGKYDDGFWVTAARQHLIQFNNSFIIIRHQAVVTHNYDQTGVRELKKANKGRCWAAEKDFPAVSCLSPHRPTWCRLIALRTRPSRRRFFLSAWVPVSGASCQPARDPPTVTRLPAAASGATRHEVQPVGKEAAKNSLSVKGSERLSF